MHSRDLQLWMKIEDNASPFPKGKHPIKLHNG
jgi:hypothetical protein